MTAPASAPRALRILAADQFPLSAHHYAACEGVAMHPPRVAIFLNATGASQDRFRSLAAYVAQSGWHALTFDYRGIGQSAIPPGMAQRVSMQAWGEQDLAAMIAWADAEFGHPRIALICHSIGGQIAALAPNAHRVDAMLAVGCQKGYWRWWPDWRRYAVLAFFQGVVPLCLGLFGHVPLQWMGLHRLERGVARDYARWTLNGGYTDAQGGRLESAHRRFRAPILSLSFDDDVVYAPKPAVDALVEHFYVNAAVIRAHLVATDARAAFDVQAAGHARAASRPGLGHSGFFDPRRCEEGLWRDCVQWLSHVADGGHPHAFDFWRLPASRYR